MTSVPNGLLDEDVTGLIPGSANLGNDFFEIGSGVGVLGSALK